MDLCRFTRLGAIGAVATLLAASHPAALGQVRVQVGQDGGVVNHSMSFRSTQDGRSVAIEMQNDEVVSATIDGEPVPKNRIKVDEDKVTIFDENGDVIFEMNRSGRGNAWIIGPNQRLFAPNMQGLRGLQGELLAPAEPPPVMLGVSLAEPDRGLRRHFGLEEGKATMLAAVYDDLPAAKAGLKPFDIIVSINGDDDAGQDKVREALRDAKAGNTITFGVIQNGQRKEVKVALEAYDDKRLADAARKYREEHGDDQDVFRFGAPFGEGQFRFFAPDMDPDEFSRRMNERLGDELRERFRRLEREQADRARELLEQHYRMRQRPGESRAGGRAEDDRARELLEQHYRMRQRPGESRAGGRAEDDRDKLDRLENRLERLERMLEKLAEEKE